MYQLDSKEANEIEVILSGGLSAKEFKKITEQIESLPTSKMDVNILFDTTKLVDHYTFKIFLDEHQFYNKYRSHVHRVAFVSDSESEVFVLEQLGPRSDMEIKTFNRIDKARKWVTHS